MVCNMRELWFGGCSCIITPVLSTSETDEIDPCCGPPVDSMY